MLLIGHVTGAPNEQSELKAVERRFRGASRRGVEGIATPPPPLSSIRLVFCLNLPKIIKNFFFKVDSLPPFDCLSSYEKINYISRLFCRVLLARGSF